MSRRNPLLALTLLLSAFTLLGAVYAAITPLFEISDELWHYPMVKTLADGNWLPVQDPANVQPWRQEGSQPPLYYMLMATATFWIDTSDLAQVRWINPHTDNGLITADRNNNILIHRADEPWRWHGTALAVRLIRFLSVLMGAGTVYFTYRLARELTASDEWLSLAAAAVTAFTPMFVFISACVNNDNLAITFSAATLWLLARWVKHPPVKLGWTHVVLGLLLGAGALSKQSVLGLFGLAGLVVLWSNVQRAKRNAYSVLRVANYALRNTLRESLVIFSVAFLVAFWWYLRNFQLYDDWLGWNTFIAIVGARPQPATLLQLWGERVGFLQAYWGLFGGVSVPLPGWTYTALNVAAGVAVIGLGWGLARVVRQRRVNAASAMQWLLICGWIALLLFGLVRWSSITWASQGRLIFPAISAISLLIAAGLWSLWRGLPWMLVALMGLLSSVVPFAVIAPHYAPPPALTEAEFAAIPNRLDADFGELKLLGYDLQTSTAQPGEVVRLTLYWQAQIAMDRNWSLFMHLVDEDGVIVAQRDRYPGQGLLATTLMTPGQTWVDEYVIAIPPYLIFPHALQIAVGVYDLRDGTRLRLANGDEQANFGSIAMRLPSMPGAAIFGGVLALQHAEIEQRVLRPGEPLTVTLQWRALNRMTTNYSVSVRVRDEALNRWA
ncbi:MAG: glycosyltransferase family 39 protein, partial [Anaerolineales bacterium]